MLVRGAVIGAAELENPTRSVPSRIRSSHICFTRSGIVPQSPPHHRQTQRAHLVTQHKQRRRPVSRTSTSVHTQTHIYCAQNAHIVRVIHTSWRLRRRQPRRLRLRLPLCLTSRQRRRSYLLLPVGPWTRLSERIGRRRFRSSWRGLRYRWYVPFTLSPFLDASAYRTGHIGWP